MNTHAPARERPILWSAPMVLALLAGRKTQTRRVIKLKRELSDYHYLQPMWGRSPPPDPVDFGTPGLFREVGPDYPDSEADNLVSPYAPGDGLWGREAWKGPLRYDHLRPSELPRDCALQWLADRAMRACGPFGRYRHARFMPRAFSRLQHKVVDVRAEQLRDITEADAIAEGIEVVDVLSGGGAYAGGQPFYGWPGSTTRHYTAREAYLAGWDSINGKGSAAKNPWAWVVTFKAATR